MKDDASSSAVQICFYTGSSDSNKSINLSTKCNKIVFKNNGMHFRQEDWIRLKRIAEGNPGKKDATLVLELYQNVYDR